MSAISSRAPEPAPLAVPAVGYRLPRPVRPTYIVDGLLAAFVLVMLTLMAAVPGQETIPYHFLFLALTIVYGFRVWPLGPTLIVTVLVTGTTGWVLATHALDGIIDISELAEVPLMPLLFVAMVWHARRRVAALHEVERMADERRASLEREREFFRDTSHAIRTPITIARGHLELASPVADAARDDIEIALHQLDRMAALSNRLLALARLGSGEIVRTQWVDVAAFVDEVGHNWSSGVERRWSVDSRPTGPVRADPEWLELALDALLENAVHFTGPGDEITLSCAATQDRCTITVADTGPGIADEDLPHIFERFWHRRPPAGPMGSGLGLPMARAAAEAHGGQLIVADGRSGGVAFELTLPI